MNKEYFAFISYQRQDEDWAKWLADQLEHYHLPLTLNGRDDLPKDLRPIFRDIDELAAGNLPQQIHQALENSKNLIVVCSPNSANSLWVNKEVEMFISLGRADKIFSFIVDGKSPSIFFPPALRDLHKNKELLGGEVSKNGRDVAFLNVVAGMLDVDINSLLYQRYEKEKAEGERKQREQRDNLAQEYQQFKNFAFISYSHKDIKQAEMLDNFLLEFRLPTQVKEKHPNLRETFHEIFRDNTGMGAATDLDFEIKRQLDQSEYLIVICSPNAVESDWVNKEIEYFKCKRGLKYIYPFVIDGIVNAKSIDESQECIPKALRPYKGRAANISTYSFEHAIIEILATILNIEVDEIWQRHIRLEEERKQKLKEQNDRLLIAQSRFLAEKANALVDEGDSYTAMLLALEALPKDLENPDRPYVIEAEAAIRKASQNNTAILRGHADKVTSIALSPDGHFIASASFDGTIRLWDTATGQTVKELPIEKMPLLTMSFSPDGQCIAYAYADEKDCSIYIWDLSKNCHQCVLNGHRSVIRSVSFSHDGLSIVSASNDGTIRVWDVSKGICRKVLYDDGKFMLYAVISSDNSYIAAASYDKTICVWDVAKGGLIRKLEGHADVVTHVSFSDDGRLLASASEDYTIRIWDTATWQCKRCLKGHQRFVLSTAFSPGNLLLVSGSLDNTIRIWDLEEGQCRRVLKGHTDRVNTVLFHQGSQYVISSSDDATIRIWELFGNEPKSVSLHDVSYYRDSYISSDGTLSAEVIGYNDICIREKDSKSILRKGYGHIDDIVCVVFSPDNKYIASASVDKTIRIWDSNTLGCIYVLKGHTTAVMDVSFSPNGQYVVSTSLDDTIRVWDVSTGLCVFVIDNEFKSGSSFTTDGSHIVSNFSDDYADIWEFSPIQKLIDDNHDRFKKRQLTSEERKKYYLD